MEVSIQISSASDYLKEAYMFPLRIVGMGWKF